MTKRLTAPCILAAKGQRKLAAITAYDYPTALLVERAGADIVLVGDSLAMVCLGHADTLSVTMDEMLHHTRAVSRALAQNQGQSLLVADMPFLSYQTGVETAVANAGRFLKEAGARAVKVEGGREIAPQVRAMTAAGIPVMGHIGLTPQHVARFGGFKAQGKTASAAKEMLADAQAMVEAGCFSMVLEAVPHEVAQRITASVGVPTIGIGAGPDCDGQVLVFHDLLGLYPGRKPSFVKAYADLATEAVEALAAYCAEVREGRFPDEAHTLHMNPQELKEL